MSTTKPHSFNPAWTKRAIFLSSSTTKILIHSISLRQNYYRSDWRREQSRIHYSGRILGLVHHHSSIRFPMKLSSDLESFSVCCLLSRLLKFLSGVTFHTSVFFYFPKPFSAKYLWE